MFVLQESTLKQLAKRCAKLKLGLINVKKRFSSSPDRLNSINVISPIIDCHKSFSNNNKKQCKVWNRRKRFKNTVLMIIASNRNRLKFRFLSFKALINKIKAIRIAEEKNNTKLALSIEKSLLPPSVIDNAKLLSYE